MVSKFDWFIDDIYNVLKEHEILIYCVSSCIGTVVGVALSWGVVIPALNAVWPHI